MLRVKMVGGKEKKFSRNNFKDKKFINTNLTIKD